MDVNKWGMPYVQHKGQPEAAGCKARQLWASRKTGMHLFLCCIRTHTRTHTHRQIQTHSERPTGNNHHPLTRESWWCSLCCRQTRRKGWCWLLYERPSVWLSRGLWCRRNSQSHRGSSQNWNTQIGIGINSAGNNDPLVWKRASALLLASQFREESPGCWQKDVCLSWSGCKVGALWLWNSCVEGSRSCWLSRRFSFYQVESEWHYFFFLSQLW